MNAGLWQLTAANPDGATVYLRGVGSEASKLLAGARITGLEFEWRPDGVMVRMTGADGIRHFKSESVVIHEPKTRLYDSLPLAASMRRRSVSEAGVSPDAHSRRPFAPGSDRASTRPTGTCVTLSLLIL